MITKVDHVEINTRDIAASVAFYCDVLGFQVSRWVEIERQGRRIEIACLTLGDFMVELLPAGESAVDQRSVGLRMLALRVDDMARTIADLRAKGVEVAGEPVDALTFDGLRAEIRDPDGVHIELREWRNGDGYRGDAWQPGEGVRLRSHPSAT